MRISKKFIKILTVMIILALFSVSGKMIMATTAQGSISILYKGRTKGDQEIALSKADFVLYQVGKDTTDGIWKLNEQFKQSKVSLTKEDAQSRQKQAIKLYQYAKKHRIKGTNNQTNEVGRLFFGNLKKWFIFSCANKRSTLWKNRAVYFRSIFSQYSSRYRWFLIISCDSTAKKCMGK